MRQYEPLRLWCRSCLLLLFLKSQTSAFSNQDLQQQQPVKVLVTGAAGKTGKLVLKRLEEDSRYEPKGLVRTERSAKQLVEGDIHCPLEHMVISDITSPTFEEDLPSGLEGMDAMVICTSSVPRISRMSLLRALLKAPFNVLRRKTPIDFRKLQFRWKHDGYPEKVDYHGQVAQIKLAKKLGMKQVVMVSSMGGTDPTNFLNNVGKDKNGNGNGDILLWKRKAEIFLVEVRTLECEIRRPPVPAFSFLYHLLSLLIIIFVTSIRFVQSDLDFFIIHPGGLVDTPGGKEDFALDVDDKLLELHSRTQISREDLADLCVAALGAGKGQKVSFDCITTAITGENAPRTAERAISDFLERSKTTNYAEQPHID